MQEVPLSIALITKDEENNLKDCLQSVIFAKQIVIVDSGSTDKTLAIAEELGCDIYREGWHGFGAQKQLAIDRCTQPWILVLDADERIPPETAALIKNIVISPDTDAAGFTFPRKNYFQGRWIKHAGWWPDRILRLFKKGTGGMTKAAVHEAAEVNGKIKNLATPIEHYTESDLSKILLKIDKYSSLGASEAFAAGKSSSPQGAFFRALFTFLQDYFLRGGMFDGKQGLTLAVTDSVNKYFKYAKLGELGKTNQSNKT